MKNLLGLLLIGSSISVFAGNNDNAKYCKHTNGTVVEMTAQLDTHDGMISGISKKFCRYINTQGNIGYVGLDTLSQAPNLAATYTEKLVLDPNKLLPTTPNDNPALNVCSLLHGTEIMFSVLDGGFADDTYGQSDICIFGDGSSISGWSMIYAAQGARDDIKQVISARSQSLNINIPLIPQQ